MPIPPVHYSVLHYCDGQRSVLFKMFTFANKEKLFGSHDVYIIKALTYWPIISAEIFIFTPVPIFNFKAFIR